MAEKMQNSLESYRPKFLNDLIRLGRSYDGGYVVNERAIQSSQYLMSFGVRDDWSFEADFLKHRPSVKISCFDYSVSKKVFLDNVLNILNEVFSIKFLLQIVSGNFASARRRLSDLKHAIKTYFGFSSFFSQENIRFYSQGVSTEKNQDFVTAEEAFRRLSSENLPENSVFLKLDIEMWEFRVLASFLKFEKYINGMAIEFHELDLLWSNFVQIMDEIKAYFDITHVHGNNWGGLIPGSKTPKVLEITFLKKELIPQGLAAREDVAYPIPGLDRPNNRFANDLPLIFERQRGDC
jgi:hypothetical protein